MREADPPAARTSRRPFRLAAYALGVTAFGAGAPTPLYAVYEARYHFNSGVLAAVFAAYTIGVLVTMLLVAPLSDVIGYKPVLFVGMGLTALSGVAFVLASGVLGLALARVISGLAVGATTSTATASMAALEPRHDQHHVARVSVAANFGGVASGICVSGLLAQYGPAPTELVFLVLIGASLAGLLAVQYIPEMIERPTSGGRMRVQRLSVPREIRLPFGVAAGALAACYSIYGYFGAIAPTFLRVSLAIENKAGSAGVIALMFGLAAIVQLGLGQVRDRRALLTGLPLILLATVVVTTALALRSLALFALGAAILGLGVGTAYMGGTTLVDRVAPVARRGEILSAYFVVGYLALAIPTIGLGATIVEFGLLPTAVAFGSALALLVATLYLVTRRTPTPPGGEGRPRDAP